MPSQINSIFRALGEWEFTYKGDPVNAPILQQLADMPESPNLPLRIISPALNRAEGELMGMTFGSTSLCITWEIDDLFLARPVPQTIGFASEATSLVQYMVAYSEKWVTNRQLTSQAFSEEIKNFSAGVYEYPARSGNQFYGVLATHVIKENIVNG
jgi:hypothetical protein